jgi:hypothetical protein
MPDGDSTVFEEDVEKERMATEYEAGIEPSV